MRKSILGAFLGLLLTSLYVWSDTTTTNFGLIIPTIGSSGWGPKISSNFVTLDGEVAGIHLSNTFGEKTSSTNTFVGPVVMSTASIYQVFVGTPLLTSKTEAMTVKGNAKFFGTSGAVLSLCDVNGLNCTNMNLETANPTKGVVVSTMTLDNLTVNNNFNATNVGVDNSFRIYYDVGRSSYSQLYSYEGGDLAGSYWDGAFNRVLNIGSSPRRFGNGYFGYLNLNTGMDNTGYTNLTGSTTITDARSVVGSTLTFSSGTVRDAYVSTLTVTGSKIRTSGINWIWSPGNSNFFAGGSGTGVGNVLAGVSNIAIGGNAGLSLNGGANNTVIGSGAGQNITSGTRNTGLGLNAIGTITGSDNVAIGFGAGANEQGSSNTYVGSGAGSSVQTLTSAIGVGFNAPAISSYTAVLGGVTNFVIKGSTPTVGSCGVSPSVSGTDSAGAVTTGSTGVTSCAVTFSQPFIYAPFCIAQTTFTATSAVVSAASTTGMTIATSASVTSVTLNYHCIGRQ